MSPLTKHVLAGAATGAVLGLVLFHSALNVPVPGLWYLVSICAGALIGLRLHDLQRWSKRGQLGRYAAYLVAILSVAGIIFGLGRFLGLFRLAHIVYFAVGSVVLTFVLASEKYGHNKPRGPFVELLPNQSRDNTWWCRVVVEYESDFKRLLRRELASSPNHPSRQAAELSGRAAAAAFLRETCGTTLACRVLTIGDIRVWLSPAARLGDSLIDEARSNQHHTLVDVGRVDNIDAFASVRSPTPYHNVWDLSPEHIRTVLDQAFDYDPDFLERDLSNE
jgi:hypothetical protein